MTDILLMNRFMYKVHEEPNSGCWLWGGGLNEFGYGQFRFSGYTTKAHRVSYQLFKGPPGGKYVLHTCDNPACVNPDHLWLGTQKDNMADMARKGRWDCNGTRRLLRGVAHPSAKLTKVQVEQIRKDPASQRKLAKKYGVSQYCIWAIKSGKTWK